MFHYRTNGEYGTRSVDRETRLDSFYDQLIAVLQSAPFDSFGNPGGNDYATQETERSKAIRFFQENRRRRHNAPRRSVRRAATYVPGNCPFPNCTGLSAHFDTPGWCDRCVNKAVVFAEFRENNSWMGSRVVTTPSLCDSDECTVGGAKTMQSSVVCVRCRDWTELILDEDLHSERSDQSDDDYHHGRIMDLSNNLTGQARDRIGRLIEIVRTLSGRA